MQGNRIAAPEASARVQGLGRCDVLRIELQPCQIRGMVDELEERRGPLHEAFEHARGHWDELSEIQREAPQGLKLEQDVSDAAYSLWLFGAIRAQVPAIGHDRAVTLIGPASIMADLIAAATRNAVDDLGARLRDQGGGDRDRPTDLGEATAAVAAWVATHAECEALVWFRFDKDWDPIHDLAWPAPYRTAADSREPMP